jgi:ABC-type nitrate/sulfonate/bicarbonate transport system substrate-binding protein
MLLALAIGAPVTKAKVEVIVPERDNLQHMAFWLARGAGYFAEEGIETDLVVSNTPAEAEDLVRDRRAPVSVLSPPMYLRLIAERTPILLVANLLANDPINIVVRKDLLAKSAVSPASPLKERLLLLRGKKIGVAPGPPTRLFALFRSVGLDASKDLEIVTVPGPSQNDLFEERGVDALYCHTPYLERALLAQDAVILVNQSAGEIAELANRQIHALVVDRRYAAEHPAIIEGLVRAIARAEALVHADPKGAVSAILKEMKKRPRREVAKIVEIYAPAIPRTPRVTKDGFEPALALYPAHQKKPSLEGIDLAEYVRAP